MLTVSLVALACGAAASRADVRNPYAVAVIIGNKSYESRDIPEVKYADRDADAIRHYVVDVLGYSEDNIIYLPNATQSKLLSVFGSANDPQGQLAQWLRPNGKSDVFVYYSGHGVPGLNDGQSYLLPVDANPNTVSQNGYPLNLLYSNLQKIGAHSVTVLLDACFSGTSAGGALLANASVLTRPANPTPPAELGGLTVLTAARADQLANWDAKHKHGLFTEYFLEAVYGKADATDYGGHGDGKITLAAVQRYLDDEMSFTARREDQRAQNATVNGNGNLVLAAFSPGHPPARHDDPAVVPALLPTPLPGPAPVAPVAPPTPAPVAQADQLEQQGEAAISRKDYSAAMALFRQAAALGQTDAIKNVGLMYSLGQGVQKDYTEALKWFRKAADLGNPRALVDIGVAYDMGRGVPADSYEAMKYFRQSADKGEPIAMSNIGILYEHGRGVPAADYGEAMRWYRQAADRGYPVAMAHIGDLYDFGRGVPADPLEAVHWFRQAADRGNAYGMVRLGGMYDLGRGVAQSDAEALRWYRAAADRDDPLAMAKVGTFYDRGVTVTRDYAEAMRWYRRAADRDNADAMNDIGVLYERGNGVPRDATEAMHWYRQAADRGSADAIKNIGVLYQYGTGVTQDYAEAMRWYRRAADKGSSEAMNLIGLMYRSGYGVTQDDAQALSWYHRSAELGNAIAMAYIGYHYDHGIGVAQDYAEAMRWYRQAADKGDDFGMNSVGFLYDTGHGVAVDYPEAMRWYRKAADRGNIAAMNNIGFMYDQGHGVTQDPVEAMRWYRQAADGGSSPAMVNLGFLYKLGRGVPVDRSEARRWFSKAADRGNQTGRDEVAALDAPTPVQPPAPVVATPTMLEDALKLTTDDRESVQEWLGALGHDAGGSDGEFGPATRAAIGAYQRSIGVAATGYLTRDVLARLQREGQARLDATQEVANAPTLTVPAVAPLNYADEMTDFGVFPQPFLQYNVGTRTPTRIPGGTMITTANLVRMVNDAVQRHSPLILVDALNDGGHMTLPNAVWIPTSGSSGDFNDQVQQTLWGRLSKLTNNQRDIPIVFFCQGAVCWESYNAALRAIHLGFRQVYWYRGGIAAWRQANLPLT
jgi:PQQ-dependent catabolism-associated CXXCW motif protein